MIRLQHGRLRVAFALLVVLFLVFSAQLIRVQGIQAGGYAERAERELMRTATLPAARGPILDSKGVVLARSVDAIDITVDQTMILDPKGTAAIIAPILKMSTAEVEASISGKRRFAYVAKLVTPQQWNQIKAKVDEVNLTREKDNRIFGLFPVRSFKRIYPAGELGAAMLGYVNADGQGAAGIEYKMNSVLAGQDGKYVYASGGGPAIPSARDILTPAKPGSAVHLTINRDIQWMAQQEIAKQVSRSKADWGTIIVMDPATGKVLALATAPSFDPGAAKPSDLASLKAFSVSDVYEPGSTGKVITVAAALEEKVVTPTTVFDVPFKIQRAGRSFKDSHSHPKWRLTTAGILAVSSNTGSIQVGEKMSPDTLSDYLRKFGVGSRTNVGLSGENPGILNPVSSWSRSTFPTIAFGQSYSVTAVQATSIFATIANDGVRVTPTLIDGYTDAQGNYSAAPISKGVRAVSEETAAAVRSMMESVVSSEGTAQVASIKGYRVAGKTGTASRYEPTCGCYRGYVSSFIGFVPADKPQLVINVTINNPRGAYYGGVIAAPLFKTVGSFALKALAIAPTGTEPHKFPLDEKQLKAAATSAATPASTPKPTPSR